MIFKTIINFCRARRDERLPFGQLFWLYFFIFTTVVFALSAGYFMVKLEKLETESQLLCQEKF